jgi:DNA polymerase-3 subunit gamma/tau
MHKIPATIRSRCSIYQFRTISIDAICGRLSFVLTETGKQYEEDAIKLIAKQADGSMRDALSIAEKLIISCEKVTAEHVMKSLCLMDSEASLQMIRSIVKGDGRQAILLLQGISEEGKNLVQLVDNILQCCTDGIVLHASSGTAAIYNTKEYQDTLREIIDSCQIELLFWYVEQYSILREKSGTV